MSRWVHLFGNWKWTGPADLVVSQVRALGADAELLLGACPYDDQPHFVFEQARDRDLRPHVTQHLRKHLNPLRLPRATRELVRLWREAPPELVHVHFDADHAAAAGAARKLARPPVLVRTLHDPPPHPPRRRRLVQRRSHLCVAPTPALAREGERSLGWAPGQVGVLEPDVDLDRYRFDEEARQRGRARLGLPPGAFAVGIVARVQRHRLWELVLNAWKLLAREPDPPHLVILGRGTHQEELVGAPVREAGMEGLVHLPGYQEGEHYREALAACDAGLFMVPGSDVTCRAVREWMAMGRGVACTRRRPLPELVHHQQDGWCFDEEPTALAAAFRESDRAERWSRRGQAAARKAASRWAPSRLAEQTRLYYAMAEAARPGGELAAHRAAKALVAVRPGWLPAAHFWAQEHAMSGSDLFLLNPSTSRDAVLDLLRVRADTGLRKILLEHSPDWDAPLLMELRRRFRVEIALLEPPGGPDDTTARWLRGQVDERWTPPTELCLGA